MEIKYFIIFGIAFSLLGLNACLNRKIVNTGKYKMLTPENYETQMVKLDSVNLIDVRTAAEYNKSHIPGAVNASLLSMKFESLVEELNLDTTKATFIYCETAHRSPYAAKKLIKLGFVQVYDLKKGMMYWRKKGLPVEN